MTMAIYDSVDHTGLFDILGQAFGALDTLNTVRQTTVPPQVTDILTRFRSYVNSALPAWMQTVEGLPQGLTSWKAYQVLATQIRTNCQNLVIQWAAEQKTQPDASLATALNYLIDAMIAGLWYVDANGVTFSLATGAGNAGDVMVCYTALRGDGRTTEHALSEPVTITVTSAASATRPTLSFVGLPAQGDRLACDWPLGSGVSTSTTATDAANSLLPDGAFDTASSLDANVPNGWIVHVGTPGTTVQLTAVPVQTIAVSGTPTGGTYQVDWQNTDGIVRSTLPLAYNASGSTLQTRLRAIPGLEKVTVASTGTSPNYTHTVTLTGVAGTPAQFTSVNHLTGGSSPTITHATTVSGSVGAYKGRALAFDSNGSQLTALYHPLTLTVDVPYIVGVRIRAGSELGTGIIASGEVRIEIVDGIGGNVVLDDTGNAAQKIIDATAIPTGSHGAYWFSFRLPKDASLPVYLRVRISSAITVGCLVWFDELAIVRATELYAGGPWVAAFTGATASVVDDNWTLTVTNDRAGQLQEWFNRVFGMVELGLLLPVSGGTSGLIPDSVIA